MEMGQDIEMGIFLERFFVWRVGFKRFLYEHIVECNVLKLLIMHLEETVTSSHMWHDQGKWVTCRKFQFLFSYTTFSKLQNASCWCKPHYYRVMKILQCQKQYKTKEFEHVFAKNNFTDILLIPSAPRSGWWAWLGVGVVHLACRWFTWHEGPVSSLGLGVTK